MTLLPLSAGGAWVDYVYALVSLEEHAGQGREGGREAGQGPGQSPKSVEELEEPVAEVEEAVAEVEEIEEPGRRD